MASSAHRQNDPVVHRPRPYLLLLSGLLGWCVLSGLPGKTCAEGTFDRARTEVRAVHAQALLEEGRGEYERGHHFRAIRVLSAAISAGAGAQAFQLRGQAYHQMGEHDKALADFRSAISLSPSDPAPYLARGDLFNTLLEYDKALIDFDKALELSPASTSARLGRGLANAGLERYASAVNDFERILRTDDRNPEALWNLGTAHMLAGRPQAAKKTLQALLLLESDSTWKQRAQERIAKLPPGPDLDLGTGDEILQPHATVPRPSSQDAPSESTAFHKHPGVPPLQPSPDEPGNVPPPSGGPATRKIPVTGTWETAFLGSRLKLTAKQSGSSLSGVLTIHGPGGGDETYHFQGTVGEDGNVSAFHHSGHRFVGKVLPSGGVSGVLTTNGGARIPFDFSPH